MRDRLAIAIAALQDLDRHVGVIVHADGPEDLSALASTTESYPFEAYPGTMIDRRRTHEGKVDVTILYSRPMTDEERAEHGEGK